MPNDKLKEFEEKLKEAEQNLIKIFVKLGESLEKAGAIEVLEKFSKRWEEEIDPKIKEFTERIDKKIKELQFKIKK